MQYQIKRAGVVVYTVKPTGQQSKKIMGENIVTMNIQLSASADFQINDYVDVFVGDKPERYFLLDLADVKKSSSIEFNYTLTLKGWQYLLGYANYLFPDANNEYTLAGQPIMGNLDTFIDLLIVNANREQSGWVKGAVDVTDYQLIPFNDDDTCLSVLATLALAFKTEWWVDGQTIHMTKKGIVEDITYQYGKGNGLYDISRTTSTDKKITTRLYAYGSDKNIPADYKGFSNKLKLPGTTPYLEKNVYVNDDPEQGVKYGVIESTQVFDDIYPHRTGTITAIGADIFTFSDSTIDFNVNDQLLGQGITAKLTFNTGQLAGYTFELSSFDDDTKEFRININQDDKAFVLPSDVIKPALGDTYVITDIAMPDSYIEAAESALLEAAQAYLDANSSPIVTYSVTCDPINFKARNITLTLGNYVHVIDTDFNLDSNIRIIGYTRDLQEPKRYTMDLSDVISIAAIVRSYQQYESVKSAVSLNKLNDINRTRMNWKTTQELRNMVYDPDGYFDGTNIRPNSIETLMLSVGAKSQQFILSGITFNPNYTGDASKFMATAGTLVQFSLFDSPYTWNVTGVSITGLDPTKAFYIYAKCSKDNTSGEIVLSETPVKVEDIDGYYMFWIGALHSVIDGVRGISLTYGQTTINGRYITTGRIQSADGGTYFDLDEGVISGKITFAAGSTGYNNITDKPDLSGIGVALANAATAQAAANAAQATGNAAAIAAANAALAAANAALDAANAATTANAVAEVTTFLSTTIDGNVIATGTLLIGDATHNNGGITGVTDSGATSVRFWAGDTYANKAIAPFRVLDNGKLFATDAEITGTIISVSGHIGNWDITAYGLDNLSTNDAYIDQQKVDGSGNLLVRAYMGTGSTDIFQGGLPAGVFISQDPTATTNVALVLKAAEGSENIALYSTGDVWMQASTSGEGNLNFKILDLPVAHTLAGYLQVIRKNDDGRLYLLAP